jgi:hypothetical protein
MTRDDALSLAYKFGAHAAASVFVKQANPSLGDPNYWQGGSQQAQQPQDAEEAIGLLPGGTFQGANIRITPEGEKSTSIKVSPDALIDPDALRAMFQADPTAKIEMQQPDNGPEVAIQGQQNTTGGAPGMPGTGGGSLAGYAPGQE